MASNFNFVNYQEAINDFYRARQQATVREIIGRLRGERVLLLSYEEVRQKVRIQGSADQGLKEIPLDAIVGSVNRYEDFTRDFLPRATVEPERWARVEMANSELRGLPPIEVYQIGEMYFVKDGNHRVSVARQLGASHIQAYVIEIRTSIHITADDQPEDLILKTEQADFLEYTHLNQIRPESAIELTAPGQYAVLEEHIAVHRYYMGIDEQRDISAEEAVTHWYDLVYLPVIGIIYERGLLRDFPNRTEADLYLWIAEHRAALEEILGWEVDPSAAAADLVVQFSPKRTAARAGEKMLDAVLPDSLESGPPTGEWRKEKQLARREGCLFSDILVPISGTEIGWLALEQAFTLARKEGARLHGLHVLPTEDQKNSLEAQAVQAEFSRRCEQAGLSGKLVLDTGEVARTIVDYARWNDLVTINLAYPPAPQPLARLGSGFRVLLQRCPTPVLAVPQQISSFTRALLAYNGSPKAEEALFIATYLAGQWKIPLVVASILQDGRVTAETAHQAQDYLESHGITAEFVTESGPIASAILKIAEAHGSDLIVLGGYRRFPILSVFIDDVVDQVLRGSRKPMLLCR